MRGQLLRPALLPGQGLTRKYFSSVSSSKNVLLFDVDGTLTTSRQLIKPVVEQVLDEVRPLASLGLVSGSDFDKISLQIGGRDKLDKFKYVFAENSLVAYKSRKFLASQSILKHLGEEKIQKIINVWLRPDSDEMKRA